MTRLLFILFFYLFLYPVSAQSLISREDLAFLKELTQAVVDSSKIYPGQRISRDFGPNQTGGVLIRPGGRTSYPAFWIRDYAMSLGTGMIPIKEQKHMLLLTASTQNDHEFKTQFGSFVPMGAIADHIRIDDSLPIYFPGTYDFENQGEIRWGQQPPLDDMFFFIQMAYVYIKQSGDLSILQSPIRGKSLFDRLLSAFHAVPINPLNQLVSVSDFNRGVDFGFRDAIHITGDLCFTSILRYQALLHLAELYRLQEREKDRLSFLAKADTCKMELIRVFQDRRGMLRASTRKSAQADVWSTSWAVYLGLLEGENAMKASNCLAQAYKSNHLAFRGAIRHVLNTDDFNRRTAWEGSLVEKNSYQNGAYWSTPTAWVAYTISLTQPNLAQQLIKELISDLKKGDFRKGKDFGAPWECFTESSRQNPVYMTSVTVPFQVLLELVSH
ncbi:hypothetical protein [Aquirufa rosea]|uniref:Glycogen debranching enzyme C-terminal domain-containing protein n=1 Tax=Aquirufa rosea TaxID=2509241 RepID=A0A4Q1C345_9BACT|nr:hypothetical protein [Aquirufa rosea]RXK52579.1 hypothetical protein ESB04_02705 [Aquirufa rosea]